MPDALRREYDIEFEEVRPKGSPQYILQDSTWWRCLLEQLKAFGPFDGVLRSMRSAQHRTSKKDNFLDA